VEKPDAFDTSGFTDGHGTDETFGRPFVELRTCAAGIKFMPVFWRSHPNRQIIIPLGNELCGTGLNQIIRYVHSYHFARRRRGKGVFATLNSSCDPAATLEHLLDWKLFNLPYALPLIFIRTLGARRSRAKATQFSAVAEKKWAVRERGLGRAQDATRIGRAREQSVVTISP